MQEAKNELSNDTDKTASSRRKFFKGCLFAAGAAALGGVGCIHSRSNALAKSSSVETSNAEPDVTDRRERRRRAQRPGYLELERSGELQRRERALWAMLERCRLCPRKCGANRLAGRTGVCSTAETFKVASFGPHYGEEAPLVGRNGSGTIFFSNCNLLCVFCQNWEINHRGDGRQTTHEELAHIMLLLQRSGCHNINLVTPTHLTPQIIRALRLAIAEGLNLPLLYNTGGYDSLEVIRLLDGVVDIYLPDFKFQNATEAARILSGAPEYPNHVAASIKEMHRQVGTLQQTDGIAHKGLLIRHLVLPENAAGTDEFVRWVVSELGVDTHVNIMGQYSPQYLAHDYPPLTRRPTREEMTQAMNWAREAGLHNFH